MRRLQWNTAYSVGRFAALVILAFLALQAHALAQNVAAPTAPRVEGEGALDCTSARAARSVTDATVAVSPSRGWQMVGHDIAVTITSNNLPADAKPLVCFSWKFKDGRRHFVPAETVRVEQQLPESKQPPKPASLKLAVFVPTVESLGDQTATGGSEPAKSVVEYSPYDQYAPLAEVRILMLGRDDKLVDLVGTVAVVRDQNYCNVPIGQGVRIDSGAIEPSTSKNWQPVGGEIEFTAKSAKPFPSDALVRVCFRWKVIEGEHNEFNDSDHIRFLDLQPSLAPTSMKLAVGVPVLWDDQPGRGWLRSNNDARIGSYAFWGLVPEAEVRTLVFDKNLNPVFDNAGKIGVTNTLLAAVLAFAALAAAFALLYLVSRKLFPDVRNPLLCVISTRRGVASLSQFQIMLWTLVVLTASVYVIALAGDLIVITPGTLILLGISGATVVIAKAKASRSSEPVGAPAAPAEEAAAVAGAAAVQAQTPATNGRTRRPRWSDLVMDEINGQELDVTRVQMLLFTLVTATFVALKVMTSYEIPDIPDGFLILMGISNGVYVSSKFAGSPSA
jgi:hypothetical protein